MKKLLLLFLISFNVFGSLTSIYNEAMKVYKSGDTRRAVEILEEGRVVGIVEGEEVEGISKKKLAAILNDYAFFLMKLEEREKAKDVLRKVIELDNQRAVAYYNLGEIADYEEDRHMARQYALIYAYLVNGERYLVTENYERTIFERTPELLKKYLFLVDYINLKNKIISSYEVEIYKDYEYVAFVAISGKRELKYFYEEGSVDGLWEFIFLINDGDLVKILKKWGYTFWHGDRVFELEAKDYKLDDYMKVAIASIKENPLRDIKFLIEEEDLLCLDNEIKSLRNRYITDNLGYDILDYAYKYGSNQVVEVVEKYFRKNDFLNLVRKNKAEEVKKYIEENKDDEKFKEKLLVVDKMGRTAYHIIAEYNLIEMAKIYFDQINLIDLIDNKFDDYQGRNAVYIASESGSFEVLKMMLEKNTLKFYQLINELNYNLGKNSLIIATEKGYYNIIKLFVENKANIEAVNKEGETPLLIASRLGYEDIARYLVEQGANVGFKENEYDSFLDYKEKVTNNEKIEDFETIMNKAKEIYSVYGVNKSLEYINSCNIDKVLEYSFERYNKRLGNFYLQYISYLIEASEKEKIINVLKLAEELNLYNTEYYMDLAWTYDKLDDSKGARRVLKKYLLIKEDRGLYGSYSKNMANLVKDKLIDKYLSEEEKAIFISGNIDFYDLNNDENYELVKLIIDYDLNKSHFVIILYEGEVSLEKFVYAFEREDLIEYYNQVKK